MKPWRKAQRATWKPDLSPSEKFHHQDGTMDCPCRLCGFWSVGAELKAFRVQRKEVYGS